MSRTCHVAMFTHGRLFRNAGSQSVYSRQTRPSRLHPLSHQHEGFPSRSGCVGDDDPLEDRAVTLAMLSARKLWASGEIGIPDESGKTKVEMVNRANLLSRPNVARRRYLIKKCNALGIGERKLVPLFGWVSSCHLNFLRKKECEKTFFLCLIKVENTLRN